MKPIWISRRKFSKVLVSTGVVIASGVPLVFETSRLSSIHVIDGWILTGADIEALKKGKSTLMESSVDL